MTPRVSICVPTYNRATSLRETLVALQHQTFEDWEAIVGDDASTDNTRDLVESIVDPRFRYVRHPQNRGIYGNWNVLLRLARGEYVGIYHDHDVYLPTILEESVRVLDTSKRVRFAHTALVVVDEGDVPVRCDVRSFPEVMDGTVLREYLANDWHSPVMAATALVRQDAYTATGYYDVENYGLGCDKDMWFRLAKGGSVGYVAEPQALIRGRTRGGPTSAFRWEEVQATIRMRALQLEEVYGRKSRENSRPFRRFERQRDLMILTYFARALLLENHEVATSGRATAEGYGGRTCRALARMLSASGSWAAYALRPVLWLHYAVQRQRQAWERRVAQREVANYPIAASVRRRS